MTDGSVVLAVIRLLVSLAVVLVLLVVLARWASRRGIGSARPGRATVEVEVLTRRSLGRNSTLQVVKIGTQVMVLGVTERGVSVLGELGEEDLVTASPLSLLPSAVPGVAPASASASALAPASATYEATESRALAPASATYEAAESRALAPASATYEAAESRAVALASVQAPAATGQTRSSRRAAASAAATRQSRSSRRAAATPTGWPWNAAAVVLGAGRLRRG